MKLLLSSKDVNFLQKKKIQFASLNVTLFDFHEANQILVVRQLFNKYFYNDNILKLS